VGSILALIPARGGSKGLPRKNVRPFGGRPLIAHTIDSALRSGCFDRVLVSTDDPTIADVARASGAEAPWLRPDTLATDAAPVIDTVMHALDRLEHDDGYAPEAVTLLQPTSPFRSVDTIRRGVDLYHTTGDSVVSVHASPAHPYWCKRIDAAGYLSAFIDGVEVPAARQDLPPAYVLNGLLYIASASTLRRSASFYGARVRPLIVDDREGLDIDTEADWALAECLWERGRREVTR
jgi:CMP-N-acetylneuraminic acid synthetase